MEACWSRGLSFPMGNEEGGTPAAPTPPALARLWAWGRGPALLAACLSPRSRRGVGGGCLPRRLLPLLWRPRGMKGADGVAVAPGEAAARLVTGSGDGGKGTPGEENKAPRVLGVGWAELWG